VGGGVIKLASIIALDAPDGASKLRGHKGKEVGEGGEGVGLLEQQESSRVVGAVIEDDQVILVTRDTRNSRAVGSISQCRACNRRCHKKRLKKIKCIFYLYDFYCLHQI
jgi:hypothetical protein